MTDFLFPKPTFLSGMARALDLGATFDAYNTSKTPAEADSIAMYNDFKAIGDDLRKAVAREGAAIEAEVSLTARE